MSTKASRKPAKRAEKAQEPPPSAAWPSLPAPKWFAHKPAPERSAVPTDAISLLEELRDALYYGRPVADGYRRALLEKVDRMIDGDEDVDDIWEARIQRKRGRKAPSHADIYRLFLRHFVASHSPAGKLGKAGITAAMAIVGEAFEKVQSDCRRAVDLHMDDFQSKLPGLIWLLQGKDSPEDALRRLHAGQDRMPQKEASKGRGGKKSG